MNKAVIFYFPYRGVGGVSTLFLRLAREMVSAYDVYVADYSDGYMAKNRSSNITLIAIDKDPKFPPNATIVFQAFLPWRFPFIDKVEPNTKVLFWGLHPKNFDPSILNGSHINVTFAVIAKIINFFAFSRRKKLANIVRYLLNRKALLFQDRESVRSIKSMLSVELPDVTFIPVPLPGVHLRKWDTPKDLLTFSWIGRICDFKYTILIHVIERLSLVSRTLGPIELLIVGDGEYIEQVKIQAGRMESDIYTIKFLGSMDEANISSFLVEQVDFLFAMGTSAIEGARVGVPVFLTDYSYKSIGGNYQFKFFDENNDFCLGEEISSKHFESTSSLEALIQSAIADYANRSRYSFQYWESNFSLNSILQKFISRLDETEATMHEMIKMGIFEPDVYGRTIRTAMAFFRPELKNDSIGFRNDR